MAVISKGTTFATGDQVTAVKLNNLADAATFASGAVDSVSTQLSGGAIIVKDGGVTTAKIADSNVTKAKIENLADYKVLGNVSGGAAAPAEVAILDEDDMVSDSDTALATQQSIKAYVDASSPFVPASYAGGESVTLPNGLIMKMGLSSSVSADGSLAVSFGASFPNAVISLVITKKVGLQAGGNGELTVSNVSTSGFTINNGQDSASPVYFQAVGY
jgi:hypothetical protein